MLRFHIIRILRITTAVLLAGRAWQHLFWDAPFEFLLSAKAGFTPWFEGQVTGFFGVLYLIGLIFTFMLDSRNSKLGYYFVIQSVLLLFLAHLYRADRSCEWPTFFLYTAQFATPFLYYLLLFTKRPIGRIMNTLKIALTITLFAYSSYAIGWPFGQPSEWLEGIAFYFGMSNIQAQGLFIGLGVLEILLALFLWIKPLQRFAFVGILFWGGLLMLASVGLFFHEHIHWKAGLRAAWELLCLVPNLALSYVLWSYVTIKKKQEEF